jgi:hypothetical protein
MTFVCDVYPSDIDIDQAGVMLNIGEQLAPRVPLPSDEFVDRWDGMPVIRTGVPKSRYRKEIRRYWDRLPTEAKMGFYISQITGCIGWMQRSVSHAARILGVDTEEDEIFWPDGSETSDMIETLELIDERISELDDVVSQAAVDTVRSTIAKDKESRDVHP